MVDDGPGIAPDLLPRVFEPTVRADGPRNSRAGGAGLGLTIAARLIHNQGGTIDAGNAPGRGANLTLRLPPITPPTANITHPDANQASGSAAAHDRFARPVTD